MANEENNSVMVRIEPDSNGNITLTIKLVIATNVADTRAPVLNVLAVVDDPCDEESESPRSENLLSSESSVGEESNGNKAPKTPESTAVDTKAPPYSLRSKVQIKEEDSDTNEDDYEVDYELSQQIGRMNAM